MECLSAKFRDLAVSLLNAHAPVIATIAKKAGGFIDEVKRRPDVRLYEITERNRDRLPSDITDIVRSLRPASYNKTPEYATKEKEHK
jgi:nucleoside-triphosphatase